MHFPVTVFIL